jgi:hypothetical protein
VKLKEIDITYEHTFICINIPFFLTSLAPSLLVLETITLLNRPNCCSTIDTHFYILTVELWNPGGTSEDRFVLPNTPQQPLLRKLVGSLVTNAFQLKDPDNRVEVWFVLHGLGVRTEGKFR